MTILILKRFIYPALLLLLGSTLIANPTTLVDEQSGFYKNSSGQMLALYETRECKDEERLDFLPIDAICIIAIERHKDGKALVEYKGQRGWVDVHSRPDDITMMHYEEMQLPLTSSCSQVGPYFFEVKSIRPGKAVKVYNAASTKAKVIQTLEDHESCLINLGCEWPWCRIDYGGQTGWVRSIELTDKIEHVDGYCYPREKVYLTP